MNIGKLSETLGYTLLPCCSKKVHAIRLSQYLKLLRYYYKLKWSSIAECPFKINVLISKKQAFLNTKMSNS